MNRIGIVIP